MNNRVRSLILKEVTLITISEGSPPQGLSEARRAKPGFIQYEDYFFTHPEPLLGCPIGDGDVHRTWSMGVITPIKYGQNNCCRQ
jgi:hypothetical protein